jgi:CRP/FNR family transcriptional regulator, cyclic AMP receptor protein
MKLTKAGIEDGKSLLRSQGWLSTVDPSFREAFLAECQWSKVEPRMAVSLGGETENAIYGVAQGEVGIIPVVAAPDAGLVHIDRAPFWYGLQPFMSGEGRHITVVARSECVVLHVGKPALNRVLANHPVGWQMLLMHLGVLFRTTLQATADLLIPDRDRRCAAVLLRIAGARSAGSPAHAVHCSHEELAAMCNLSRQTIAAVLRQLEEQGHAELGYRSIRLLDPERLRRDVDGA